jgi:hypothetical protein
MNIPRQAAACPDHPRAVSVREDYLLAAIGQFSDERITGPDRRALLDAAIPAGAADRAAKTERQAAEIATRIRQIDAAETGLTRELETLSADTSPATAVALSALRGRIVARFGELEAERAGLTTRSPASGPRPPGRPARPGRHPGTRPPPAPGPPVRRLRHPGPLQPRRLPGHHQCHPHRRHPGHHRCQHGW